MIFSSDEIKAKIKADGNALNLQTYAVQYSFSSNYKASIETHILFDEKKAAQRNTPKEVPQNRQN